MTNLHQKEMSVSKSINKAVQQAACVLITLILDMIFKGNGLICNSNDLKKNTRETQRLKIKLLTKATLK